MDALENGSRPLALAQGVHFCVTCGHAVFLDLNRDSYSAVRLAGLSSHHEESGVGAGADLPALLLPHCEELWSKGLLTRDTECSGDLAAFRSIPPAVVHVFDPDDQRPFGMGRGDGAGLRPDAREVAGVLWACRRASGLLRKRHISDIVGGVSRRKGAAPSKGDALAFRRHAEIFHRVRPWYPKAYRCLFDSLALVEYLALRRCFGLWVFGVQLQPFGAHCWVQADSVLLNESLEFAQQFSPIMAV